MYKVTVEQKKDSDASLHEVVIAEEDILGMTGKVYLKVGGMEVFTDLPFRGRGEPGDQKGLYLDAADVDYVLHQKNSYYVLMAVKKGSVR